MNEPSPQHFESVYLGCWETRNLRMAASIRAVPGLMPGMKLLVVGASHKACLKA